MRLLLKIELFLERCRNGRALLACGWLEPHLCGCRDVESGFVMWLGEVFGKRERGCKTGWYRER